MSKKPVIYCGVSTLPLEYVRYYSKYDKCLEWMKENHPDYFAEEIKDIQDRDPKTAKKIAHLLDGNVANDQQEEKDNDDNDEEEDNQQQSNKQQSNQQQQSQQKGKRKRGGRKRGGKRGKGKGNNNNQNDEDDYQQTKQVQIMEDQVNQQQDIAQQNMDDIQGMLDKLSTSPSKGILKNPNNPNYEQEQENLNNSQLNSDDDSDDLAGPNFLGAAGNRNKARGPPARKDTKKKKRKKKHNRDRRRPKDEEEEDAENKENEEEEEESFEQRQKRVKFERMKNKKVPKNIVEVTLENRKGNKKVTIVRGFIEKSKDKEQRIKSEFMKKFATSCMITFQNQGSDKGPKQVVLMGDKRYDFMKYLKDKFPKAGKLLYYKTKKYGLTPAVDPDHGFVMPPP